MHSSTTVAALVALIPLVAAHGHVTNINAGGVDYPLQGPQWQFSTTKDAGWRANNLDDGFVASDSTSLAGSTIACHKGLNGAPGAQPGLGTSVPVAAGSSVTLSWNTWPVTHHGPVINYLAKCPGKCSELTDATQLKFFKIQAEGLITPGNVNGWATDKLIAAGFKGSVTIPKNLAAGEYVLRHEILALHAAGSTGGAQFYPQCVSINVSGSGTANPSGVLGSTFYKSNDPGVLFNLYSNPTTYTIPGPAVVSI